MVLPRRRVFARPNEGVAAEGCSDEDHAPGGGDRGLGRREIDVGGNGVGDCDHGVVSAGSGAVVGPAGHEA
jgi:hypothetical protein